MIKPVLLPQRTQFYGVGTPYILYDIKRDKHWLLFTGWSDRNGIKREGYVAPIDRSLNVDLSRAVKILPYNFPVDANYTNNAVRGFYNETRDEYYITSTHGDNAYLFIFDPEWKLKGYKILMKDLKKDSGLPIRPTGAYRYMHDAIAVSPNSDSSGIELYRIMNIYDLEKVTVQSFGEFGVWSRANDVLDLTLIPRLQVFVEMNTLSKWMLQTFIGPSLDEIIGIEDLDKFAILQGSLMPLLGIDDTFVQVGHPHYTTEPDGKPKLFFVSFRDTYTVEQEKNKEGYAHEIWVEEVPLSIFDPRSYGELRGKFKGKESKWYYVPYAKRLIIGLTDEAELLMKINIYDEIIDKMKLKKGINVIDNPVTWIKIYSDKEIEAIIKAIY